MIETIDVPRFVAFEIPHDYAAYCGGSIVAVGESSIEPEFARIGCDGQWIVFESNGAHVKYLLRNAIKLVLNPSENVKGQLAATVRMVFEETDGTVGTLPVFSTNGSNSDWLREIAMKWKLLSLPIPIEDLANSSRDS